MIVNNCMDSEECHTVLCEIEAIVISRSLSHIFNKIEESESLTSPSFPIGEGWGRSRWRKKKDFARHEGATSAMKT